MKVYIGTRTVIDYLDNRISIGGSVVCKASLKKEVVEQWAKKNTVHRNPSFSSDVECEVIELDLSEE